MKAYARDTTPKGRERHQTVARRTTIEYHNLVAHPTRHARVQTLPRPNLPSPLSQELELSEDQHSDESSKTEQNTLQQREREEQEQARKEQEQARKEQEQARKEQEQARKEQEQARKEQEQARKEQEEREKAMNKANLLVAAGLYQHALDFCKDHDFLFRQACDARNLLIHNCFPSPDDPEPLCQSLITRGQDHCQNQLKFLSAILGYDEIKQTTNPHTFPLPSCDTEDTKVQISVLEEHCNAFQKIACARAYLDRKDIGYLLRLCADTWRYLGTRLDSPKCEHHYPNWAETANFFYCAARYNLVDVGENSEIKELDFVEFSGSGDRRELFEQEIAEEYTGLILNYTNFLFWMRDRRVLNAALVIAEKAERLIAEYLDKVPEDVYPQVRMNYLGLREVRVDIHAKIYGKPRRKW